MGTVVKEGEGYLLYTLTEDALTSHAPWDERDGPREHFGICELIAEALGYDVGEFMDAMRYHYWLHHGPPSEQLPEDHWIRAYRREALQTRCPRVRYRIVVEAEELQEEVDETSSSSPPRSRSL